jgi:hypothetical protein
MLYCSAIDYLACAAPLVLVARPTYQCPTTLPKLTELMVRDLPSYANRSEQRQRSKINTANYTNYLTAGRPEIADQLIENPEYRPTKPTTAPLQLYLSTLEKRYVGKSFTELQQFHWLFLAKGKQDWYLVAMYSRQGQITGEPLPPVESLQSPVGDGVKIWLRDCNAGRIQPLAKA